MIKNPNPPKRTKLNQTDMNELDKRGLDVKPGVKIQHTCKHKGTHKCNTWLKAVKTVSKKTDKEEDLRL